MTTDIVSLVATKAFTYAGHSIKVGDRFTAPEKDAKLLKMIQSAKDAPVKRQYHRRDMTAEGQ